MLEAIFRRLRSRSPHTDHLSTTHARRQPARTSFDARANCTRPAIRGMFACLSTLTRACRTALASVHIFRRPRPRSPRDVYPKAATAVPAFICISRRKLPLATQGARFTLVFRGEDQACSTACAVYRHRLLSFDTRLRRRLGTSFHSHLSMRASAGTHVARLRADLSTSRSSGNLGAWIDPHLSTLTTHQHFRAHARACFRAYLRSHLIRAHIFRLVTAATASRYARPHTCSIASCGRSRTHSLRAFIFSVLSSRKFGSFVSLRAALLELSSLPTRPSRLRNCFRIRVSSRRRDSLRFRIRDRKSVV